MKIKKALILPDSHVPFEDKRAYALMLKVAKYVKPDEIVILGDYLDFYSVSAHAKDSELANLTLKQEVDAGSKRLEELDILFPRAKKVFIEGNHEFRLARYLRDRAPDLFGLVDLPEILGLNKRKNWKWIPYGPYQKYKVLKSKLHARHEPLAGSAKATATRAMASVIYGHIHSIEEHQVVSMDGSNYRAISVGWLGDTKHKAFSYVKNHAQWSHGFGIVHVLPNGDWFHQTIHIIDYQCVYAGKLFKS